jgi:divalent metal cation (Fe/Co/Zn/Cd) transporter
MDEAASPETRALLESLVAEHGAGAIQAHDVRTRRSGQATFIEFHLVVPGAMSVFNAHEICDRLERAINSTIPGARATIHVEPEHKAKARGVPLS